MAGTVSSNRQRRDLQPERERSPLVRAVLIAAGTVALALGILGIFLPLLPTTPFLLLAAGCYIRSSERLYRWILTNRWTGPTIRNFQQGQGMPRRAKITTIAVLWPTLLVSAYLVPRPWVWGILLIVGIGVTWLIASISKRT